MFCWQPAFFFSPVFPRRSLLRLTYHLPKCLLRTTALRCSRIRGKSPRYTGVYRLGKCSLLLKCAVRGARRSVVVAMHTCVGCTPLCGGRCTHRYVRVVCCSIFFGSLTVIFQRPHDFPRDATAAVTVCSSPCTS